MLLFPNLQLVSEFVLREATRLNQRLWAFVVDEKTLKLDRIFHHHTQSDQSTEELMWTMIMYYITIFIAVTVVDFLLVRPLTWAFLKALGKPTTKLTKTSWLLLHATFNTFVTLISLHEAAICLSDPTVAYYPAKWWGTNPGSLLGAIAIGAFHLQHFAFYEFTTEDIIHHLLNAGVVVVIGVLCPWGRITAVSNLVMCGIPGGINYFALWLRKGELIGNLTQKKLNRAMNIVLRYPIQLISAYIIYINVISDRFPVTSWPVFSSMIFGAIAHTGNSLYYADQVVGNYHVFRASERTSKSIEPSTPASPGEAPKMKRSKQE